MCNTKKIIFISIITFFSTAFVYTNSDKMRILFCVKSFPSHTSWFILNQIVTFAQEGHEITILARDSQSTNSNDRHPDIIQYNLLEKTFVNNLPRDLHSFDIILCQFSSLAPYIINFIKKNNITGKLFIFVRGAFCHRHPNQQEIRNTIFTKADLLAPVCFFSKKKLIELDCNPVKIEVIHSTIDLDKFFYQERILPKDTIKIVTTSRLSEQKGLEFAIKAMKIVLQKYPNCIYTIIGDGELKNELITLIHKLNLEKNVLLVGWKKPEEVEKILNDSHFFLHPSVTRVKNGGHEAIPTAIMEAMAKGLPVITTYHAGIPELIKDGENGFLVPERNILALANKIIFLIEHPENWNIIGKAGRESLKKDHDKYIENKRFIQLCKKHIQ